MTQQLLICHIHTCQAVSIMCITICLLSTDAVWVKTASETPFSSLSSLPSSSSVLYCRHHRRGDNGGHISIVAVIVSYTDSIIICALSITAISFFSFFFFLSFFSNTCFLYLVKPAAGVSVPITDAELLSDRRFRGVLTAPRLLSYRGTGTDSLFQHRGRLTQLLIVRTCLRTGQANKESRL